MQSLVNTDPYVDTRFAKWKREGFQHGAEHQELFQRLLNRVRDDLVRAVIACVVSV
jgi:hypothetical protein